MRLPKNFGETDGDKRPSGKGLAMYADNQYYYGEWKNGARSGNGMWIKYYVYDQNANAKDSIYLQHSYSGSWANDLPNGDGAEHYDFIDENLEPEVAYNRNFIGNFKDGLYHGEIYITNYNRVIQRNGAELLKMGYGSLLAKRMRVGSTR